jgi:hypothetical protein
LGKKEYDLIISDFGRGSEQDAGIRMFREIKRHFGKIPPLLIYSSIKAITKYGELAKKEGALLATCYTKELVQEITRILENKKR